MDKEERVNSLAVCYATKGDGVNGFYVVREEARAYKVGYHQAEQDIISLIESRIGEILGDAQPAPVLRAELREIINRIKEQ